MRNLIAIYLGLAVGMVILGIHRVEPVLVLINLVNSALGVWAWKLYKEQTNDDQG